MKNFKIIIAIMVLLILLSFIAKAQKYEEIVGIEKTLKKGLHERAIMTFATMFKNSNNVIKSQNKETGTIIGKGYFELYTKSKGKLSEVALIGVNSIIRTKIKVDFTLSIFTKDNRYKIIIDGINQRLEHNVKLKKSKESVLKKCDNLVDIYILSIIEQIKLSMRNKSENEKEW